jgi:glutamine amidotransferase PdxT
VLPEKLKNKICITIALPVVSYGSETWSLTVQKEQRLGVFEKRVLRNAFGHNREKYKKLYKIAK